MDILLCTLIIIWVLLAITIAAPLQKVENPSLEIQLIGREVEMTEIQKILNDPNVTVLTLWGSPGLGKSLMAYLLGHKMEQMGYTVHYILVNDAKFTNVDDLTAELEKISGYPTSDFKDWAKHQPRTLLILDNVDGKHWSNKKKFKVEFLDKLSASSGGILKILVTSQHRFKSKHKGKSYNVLPLTPDSCISLARWFDSALTERQSHSICRAVGCVPLAVKVMVKGEYFKIEKETKDDKVRLLKILEEIPERLTDDEERLIAALNLTFSRVRQECQVTCFLLYKFNGHFTRRAALRLITPDIMRDRFNLNRCFTELVKKSFVEKVRGFNSSAMAKKPDSYMIHALIASYLSRLEDYHNCSSERRGYWQNFFERIKFPPNDISISYAGWRGLFPKKLISGYSFKPKNVNEVDLECFKDILEQNDKHSYHLVAYFFTSRMKNNSFPTGLVGLTEHWDSFVDFIRLARNFVLTDMRNQDMPPVASIHMSRIIYTYYNMLSYHFNFPNVSKLMNVLMDCERKIELMCTSLSTEHISIRVLMLIERSYFHHFVDEQCHKVENDHEVCQHRWRQRLLILHRDLEADGNDNMYLLKGLAYYATYEDSNATNALKSAIDNQCCQTELHNGIAYIALYDIYSRNGSEEDAQFALEKIHYIYNQPVSSNYFSSAYGYIIIPFLRSVNKTKLMEKLCGRWVETYCTAYCINKVKNLHCDPYYLHRYRSHEEILVFSFCPKSPRCSGCEKIMPQHFREAWLFLSNFRNQTLLSKHLDDMADFL